MNCKVNMPVPSLEPPSENKRTVWPVLLAVLHGLSFIAGFCVVIPVSLSYIHGQCILFGSTEPNSLLANGFTWIEGAHQNCSYVTTVTAIFCIVYSAGMVAFQSFMFVRKICLCCSFHMMNIIFCTINVAVTFLMLAAAFVVTAGFAKWCSKLIQIQTQLDLETHKEDFQKDSWYVITDDKSGEKVEFYKYLSIAQVAVWVCFAVWLTITTIDALNVWRTSCSRSSRLREESVQSLPNIHI